MKLYVLFLQRREKYNGEHAPEALEVADEWAMEEVPQWLERKKAKWEKELGDECANMEIVEIDLGKGSQERIRAILNNYPKLTATIK